MITNGPRWWWLVPGGPRWLVAGGPRWLVAGGPRWWWLVARGGGGPRWRWPRGPRGRARDGPSGSWAARAGTEWFYRDFQDTGPGRSTRWARVREFQDHLP